MGILVVVQGRDLGIGAVEFVGVGLLDKEVLRISPTLPKSKTNSMASSKLYGLSASTIFGGRISINLLRSL